MQIQNTDGYVSKQIAVGNSTTVPSGEMWKVTVTYGEDNELANSGGVVIELNSKPVLKLGHIGGNDSGHGTDSSATLIVTGGDTIGTIDSGGTTNAHVSITGFRIQDTVDNTPVQEILGASDSVSVPSGEAWLVYPTCGDKDATENSATYVVNVNGNPIVRLGFDSNDNNKSGVLKNYGPEMVLTSGDTVSYDTYSGIGSNPYLALFGWKV